MLNHNWFGLPLMSDQAVDGETDDQYGKDANRDIEEGHSVTLRRDFLFPNQSFSDNDGFFDSKRLSNVFVNIILLIPWPFINHNIGKSMAVFLLINRSSIVLIFLQLLTRVIKIIISCRLFIRVIHLIVVKHLIDNGSDVACSVPKAVLSFFTFPQELRNQVSKLLVSHHALHVFIAFHWDDCSITSEDLHEWGAKMISKMWCDCFESILHQLEVCKWVSRILWCQYLELNDYRAFIDLDYLEIGSVDTKSSSHSIREFSDTIVSIELIEGPLKAYSKHNSIPWVHKDRATRLDPELKEVLYSDVSVLSAVVSCRHFPGFRLRVPVGGSSQSTVFLVDLVGTSIWVVDLYLSAHSGVAIERELLLLGWCSCVFNGIVARNVQESWESLLTLLAGIGTVPAVIHVGVEAVVETSILVLDVERLC